MNQIMDRSAAPDMAAGYADGQAATPGAQGHPYGGPTAEATTYSPAAQEAIPRADAGMDILALPADATPEQVEEAIKSALEEREQRRQARATILDRIGMTLDSYKEQAITYRIEFEDQWIADHAQYQDGAPMMLTAKAARAAATDMPEYKQSKDNITRPAVLMVTSRTADMLFPTSDRNWDIAASPEAQIPRPLLDAAIQAEYPQGLPPDVSERTVEQAMAERRVQRMRQRIDDQLQQSNYSAAGRECIADATMYGTGVLKGPVASMRRARVYDEQQGRWVRKWKESPDPAVQHVDLFEFYPMPCRSIDEAPGAFELHLMSSEKVRELAEQPGFDPDQVRRVLGNPPSCGSLLQTPLYRAAGVGAAINLLLADRYPVWEYHGSLPKEGVTAFISGLAEAGNLDPTLASEIVAAADADPLTNVQCECWMSGGVVMKLTLEALREGQPVYHVYNYERRIDSLFGNSVPYVIREDQVAATQLWQAMMLNSMMSAGLQIGVRKGALTDAQGNGAPDLSFTKPRVWTFTDDVEDIEKAMQVFVTPSVLGSIMPLYERAKKNAEEHIVLPAIVQGDPTQSVQTSSGLAMLMNAGNVVSRRLAKAWDDNITTPLLTAFYEFNMEHGAEDAKGDFTIVPRGSSHLLVKDVQSQRFLFALQMYSKIPQLEKRMKWPEWGRIGLTVMDMDAAQMLYSDEEMDEMEAKQADNPAAPDPQVIRAQAAQAEAEARMQQAQAQGEIAMMQMQHEAQMKAADHQLQRDGFASKERIAHLSWMAAIASLDQKDRATMMKLEADQRSKAADTQLEATKIAVGQQRDQLEIAVEAPNPRLA